MRKPRRPGAVLSGQDISRESLEIQKHNVSRIQKLGLKAPLSQQHKEVKSQ